MRRARLQFGFVTLTGYASARFRQLIVRRDAVGFIAILDLSQRFLMCFIQRRKVAFLAANDLLPRSRKLPCRVADRIGVVRLRFRLVLGTALHQGNEFQKSRFFQVEQILPRGTGPVRRRGRFRGRSSFHPGCHWQPLRLARSSAGIGWAGLPLAGTGPPAIREDSR